jgi:arginine exporter protein ArgO
VIGLLVAAGIGVALGIVTGLPLGLVNVAVAEAAQAGRRLFATGIGLGGALADGVHAALAFLGVGKVVAGRSEYKRALAIVVIAIALAYAITVWRRRSGRSPTRKARGAGRYGVLVGVGLTLPNPAALAAWVAVATAVWPTISIAGALVLAAGVVVGSALYFTTLAYGVGRLRRTTAATDDSPRGR